MTKSNGENIFWRIVNAVACVLALVGGFCSRETYDLIRTVGHVSNLNAMVRHSLVWSLGMAILLAIYVYYKALSDTRDAVWASDRALTILFVAAIAFLPLPLSMVFMLKPGTPGSLILYMGYALKSVCFVYLYWVFFRYHVLDYPYAVSCGWSVLHGRRAAPPTSETDTENEDDQTDTPKP
ncbi:MAG: hypothetical protein J7M12_04135 [Candidatus Hydrogenedentes bacterium]|nr:hypothetical protein [Candidatus Hydrogenedentota bacterium]